MTTALSTCTTTACAFNDGGCTAAAVTVGGNGTCATFSNLDLRATPAEGPTLVGACHRLDCKFNEGLTCSAPDVTIEGNVASCATYEAR